MTARRQVALEWVGFEPRERDLLRGTVLVEGARTARVLVTVTADGRVVDIQSDDWLEAGTTGEQALDQEVVALALERLTAARDAAAYATVMRRRAGNARRSGHRDRAWR
jgi:hypothetical protein